MRSILAYLAAAVLPLAAFGGTPQEQNFVDTAFASGLNQPTCIAWAPDGSNRLFVSLKTQGIGIIENGTLKTPIFAPIDAFTNSECGVLGLAFDPDYATNHYVYVFVTVSNTEQQILRFTDQNGQDIQRTTILANLPTAGINHDGGALGFGPDGMLYFAIGDNGVKRGVDADLTSLASKVGRCNKDGTVPIDNPFNDGVGPNNDYIWATGFRNPFTMTFQPGTGRLWLNVVGSTPDGQTAPRSGPGYEQAFIVQAGDDGGYDDYEGNQPPGTRYNSPFPRPLIRPRIQYKTDYNGGGGQVRQITTAQRASGTLTVTTSENHPYRVGQAIILSDASALTGVYTVQNVVSPTRFTAVSNGPVATASTGQVDALPQGGSITGGVFYTSTGFPQTHRGNFFYGDYVGGYIMRAELADNGKPTRISRFIQGAGSVVDVDVGPDGALYYADIGAGTVRRVAFQAPQGLIVSPTNLNIQEGSTAAFSVRLATPPDSETVVQIHNTYTEPADHHEISVVSGESLIFTPANFNVPQQVVLQAAVDADSDPDNATFVVTAPGFEPVEVRAKSIDANLEALVVSTTNLELQEGTATEFTVALPSQPAAPVKVRVRPTSGQKGKINVQKGALLLFTPKNWDTPQTVRVRGKQDANSLDQNVTLTVKAKGYQSVPVSVVVHDDDPAKPHIIATFQRRTVVGLPYEFDVEATGVPAPTFSLLQAPEGMTIDSATGVISWTPPETGSFVVQVQAENTKGQNRESFTLTVTEDTPPTAFILQPVSGATISGANAEFFGGGTDDYATVKGEFYVDGQLVYTDINREGHYHINGAHNLFDTTKLSNGPHTLKLVVYDDKNQSGEASVTVTVSN
jgi:glucose/arabinose dehydrogenase